MDFIITTFFVQQTHREDNQFLHICVWAPETLKQFDHFNLTVLMWDGAQNKSH